MDTPKEDPDLFFLSDSDSESDSDGPPRGSKDPRPKSSHRRRHAKSKRRGRSPLRGGPRNASRFPSVISGPKAIMYTADRRFDLDMP